MIDPRGMTLTDWADSVILSLTDAFAYGKLMNEAGWQDWATGLVRSPSFSARNLPDPYAFKDWREWAMRAYPMLEETAA
ncbi:hypothetical protein [Caulobacter phage KcrB]|nr:hypothetical protein RW_GP067c [Caulobacter phage RW]WCA46371.1 hypothetical protein [Caulobacter phage KcrB]WCD56306.1 hypothetical protein [Caulobacter phage RLK]WNV48098.1 hypothetical protein GB2A_gp066c [Caulobacter phage GB2A]